VSGASGSPPSTSRSTSLRAKGEGGVARTRSCSISSCVSMRCMLSMNCRCEYVSSGLRAKMPAPPSALTPQLTAKGGAATTAGCRAAVGPLYARCGGHAPLFLPMILYAAATAPYQEKSRRGGTTDRNNTPA
jgi:hypothetical protein